jgi:hypothetical protein
MIQAFYGNGSKHKRLIKDIRFVPDRHMRDGPGAFQADHPGSDATHWKCNPVEPIARKGSIEFRHGFARLMIPASAGDYKGYHTHNELKRFHDRGIRQTS